MNGHDPRYIEYSSEILRESVELLEALDVPYLGFGGMAKSHYGEREDLRDIDFLVREEDVDRVIGAFDESGYRTEKTYPEWLYKAFKHEVMVDLIFHVQRRFRLDEDMMERSRYADVEGTKVRLIGPEDLVLTLALANRGDTSYWYDALGILGHTEIDWEYLVRRAAGGGARVASLLLYARSDGIDVPGDAIQRMCDEVTTG